MKYYNMIGSLNRSYIEKSLAERFFTNKFFDLPVVLQEDFVPDYSICTQGRSYVYLWGESNFK